MPPYKPPSFQRKLERREHAFVGRQLDPSFRWDDGLLWRGMTKGGWVYIMASGRNGTLYTGVTADLPRRIYEHKSGEGSGFCARYGVHTLVYAEHHGDIEAAIRREKSVKAWKRAWKLQLIEAANPTWAEISTHGC